jgi:hypothetical protein
MSRYEQIKQRALAQGIRLLEEMAAAGQGNYENVLDGEFYSTHLLALIPEKFTERWMNELLADHPALFATDTSEFVSILRPRNLIEFFRVLVRLTIFNEIRDRLEQHAIALGISDDATYWAEERASGRFRE